MTKPSKIARSPTQPNAEVVPQAATSVPDTPVMALPAASDIPAIETTPVPVLLEGAVSAPDTFPAVEASPATDVLSAPVTIPLTAWQISGEAVIGLAHRHKGLPCQDAVAWRNSTRPILALSDGAGSAAISERGAKALVSGVSRFMVSMEDMLSLWLDQPADHANEQSSIWAQRLLSHAKGILDDLAQSERRSVRDVRATLLVTVIGTAHTFWWWLGDGAIVIREGDGLRTLGNPAASKREFANQTCFVDIATSSDLQYGLVRTENLFGIALMSDGGAEKLVAHDGSRVAARIGEWFDAVTQQALPPDKIALAFHEPAMWERTNLDDRSVLLAARTGQRGNET